MSQTRRFLVVERDAELRFAYRCKIAETFPGAAVVEVESCAAALHTLAHDPFDAVVVNQEATDARGPEILQRIRQAHPHALLVSIGENPQRAVMELAGADAFVEAAHWGRVGETLHRIVSHPNAGR